MTPAKSRTEGPTMPCPLCGTVIRTIWNRQTDEYTTYHGEDALTTTRITAGAPLTTGEATDAALLMVEMMVYQLAAFHADAVTA